mmetsp:Transcript_9562/g.20559  ORF Transcript_9562/g.20559 Transcript_9562/m.20559 type:complete len:84 (-) Transcript_9562:33-284(-)
MTSRDNAIAQSKHVRCLVVWRCGVVSPYRVVLGVDVGPGRYEDLHYLPAFDGRPMQRCPVLVNIMMRRVMWRLVLISHIRSCR